MLSAVNQRSIHNSRLVPDIRNFSYRENCRIVQLFVHYFITLCHK